MRGILKIFYLFQDLVVSIVVKTYKDMLDFMSGSKISAVIGTVLLIVAFPIMVIVFATLNYVFISMIMATQDFRWQIAGWALVMVMDFIFALNLFRKKN